jgi:hypothetical protein
VNNVGDNTCPLNSHAVSPADFFSWDACGSGFPKFPGDLNPIKFTSLDNNGWILKTPSVPAGGTSSLPATLTLGLGTRSNNSIDPSVKILRINQNGFNQVQFQGQVFKALLDTGTPEWIFPQPLKNVPRCAASGGSAQIYCPSQVLTLDVKALGGDAGPEIQSDVSFQISSLSNMKGPVFEGIGVSPSPDSLEAYGRGLFILGAPFFFGRAVYYGIAGAETPGGVGPFNAF